MGIRALPHLQERGLVYTVAHHATSGGFAVPTTTLKGPSSALGAVELMAITCNFSKLPKPSEFHSNAHQHIHAAEFDVRAHGAAIKSLAHRIRDTVI